jgi:hypothetical protein
MGFGLSTPLKKPNHWYLATAARHVINSYVVAARHFALGDAAIYGLLRLRLSTLIARNLGPGVIADEWFTGETGSL